MSTFTAPSDVTALALARSANVNDLSSAVSTAFALLPNETRLKNGTVEYGTCTGSGNAYEVALDSAPTSYADGLLVCFKANHSNTGAATINVNSLGAKTLTSHLGTALAEGDLFAGRFYSARYNSSSGNFELQQATTAEIAGSSTITVTLVIEDDASPTLGGDLDTNENDILIDDGHGIQDEGGNQQITFSTTASAVNEFTVKNAATGNAPQLQATGGDANISIKLVPKGTGGIDLSDATILDSSGNEFLKFSKTDSAVNEFTIANSAAGTPVQLQATGGDTNIDISILPKGTGAVQLADAGLYRPKLKDYSEVVNAIGSIGGGSQTIDLELGNVVSGTVDTAETTFTFSNPPAPGTAGSFTLILTNGGSQTVNWPASVYWPNGVAPVLTAAGIDILTFFTLDAGTIWYGFHSGVDMK